MKQSAQLWQRWLRDFWGGGRPAGESGGASRPSERRRPSSGAGAGFGGLLVVVALAGGCASARVAPEYRVEVPTLNAKPLTERCKWGEIETECITVIRSDWNRVVDELIAACLSNGQSPKDCQAE